MTAPSMPQSETSTIAIPEDAHHSSHPHRKEKHEPHVAFPEGTAPARDHNNLTLTRTRSHESHNDTRPDLSFPFGTTDLSRGGFTNEYRAVSESGYMAADLALRPVPSRVYRLPQALADPEKAAELKQMKLVTWKEDDPEDPRNWSSLYRWCTSSPLGVVLWSCTHARLQISRLYALLPSSRLRSQVQSSPETSATLKKSSMSAKS